VAAGGEELGLGEEDPEPCADVGEDGDPEAGVDEDDGGVDGVEAPSTEPNRDTSSPPDEMGVEGRLELLPCPANSFAGDSSQQLGRTREDEDVGCNVTPISPAGECRPAALQAGCISRKLGKKHVRREVSFGAVTTIPFRV
jgi:hypothetical protein